MNSDLFVGLERFFVDASVAEIAAQLAAMPCGSFFLHHSSTPNEVNLSFKTLRLGDAIAHTTVSYDGDMWRGGWRGASLTFAGLDVLLFQLPDLKSHAELVRLMQGDALPPVLAAVAAGDCAALRALLEGGASLDEWIECKAKTLLTPMSVAIRDGRDDVLAILLEFGAPLEFPLIGTHELDAEEVAPLALAAWYGRDSTVRMLIEAGAQVCPESGVVCPLSAAARIASRAVTLALLDAGCELDNESEDEFEEAYAAGSWKLSPVLAAVTDAEPDVKFCTWLVDELVLRFPAAAHRATGGAVLASTSWEVALVGAASGATFDDASMTGVSWKHLRKLALLLSPAAAPNNSRHVASVLMEAAVRERDVDACCVLLHSGASKYEASSSVLGQLRDALDANPGDAWTHFWASWLDDDDDEFDVNDHMTRAAFEAERDEVCRQLYAAQTACQWRRVWRERAFEACVALQALALPVLQTVAILDALDEAVERVEFHVKWTFAQTVKHAFS